MPIIEVQRVSKSYKIYERKAGFVSAVSSMFRRKYIERPAVSELQFSIEEGEAVGYIGPNGAGKSTTIKMLSGVLVPTSGKVWVNGIEPYKDRRRNAYQIGVVFGQRSQLHWDLPVSDSLRLHQRMYHIPEATFKENLNYFSDMLQMKDFIHKPVRQLSLGQKMRSEIAASLIHNPRIIFLDEPTIGLDVIAKNKIRNFLRSVNKEKKVTIILTTHDMDDIEQICDRLMLIDKGKLLIDGSLAEFKEKYAGEQIVAVTIANQNLVLRDARVQAIRQEGNTSWLRFNSRHITLAEVMRTVIGSNELVDMEVKTEQIEDMILRLYEKNSNHEMAAARVK